MVAKLLYLSYWIECARHGTGVIGNSLAFRPVTHSGEDLLPRRLRVTAAAPQKVEHLVGLPKAVERVAHLVPFQTGPSRSPLRPREMQVLLGKELDSPASLVTHPQSFADSFAQRSGTCVLQWPQERPAPTSHGRTTTGSSRAGHTCSNPTSDSDAIG